MMKESDSFVKFGFLIIIQKLVYFHKNFQVQSKDYFFRIILKERSV